MLNEILIQLYERDLAKLKTEVEQYADDADMWKKSGEITNSAGNLALHLTGNLKHFIGTVLGGSGFVRNRDLEFSDSGVSRADMLADIDETNTVIKSTIEKLTDADFSKTYPIEVFGQPMTTGYFLIHLATHFNYHLGQINYHRRIMGGN